MALRMARAATGRRRVVKFEGHYHGWFDDILVSVTPSKLPEPSQLGATRESLGQVVPGVDQIAVLPWNDISSLREEVERNDVAAVIMEPIAANHSVIEPDDGFLQEVRLMCTKAGTVLIFDEIITGFRLGLGGAQSYLGVTPDIGVFGKAMASGFPISCVAGREELFEGIGDGAVVHAGTFNGNVGSVAAALATLDTLEKEPEFFEQGARAGKRLIAGLVAMGAFHVQGLPELFWIGFGAGPVRSARELLTFDQEGIASLAGELTRRGVYVTSRGTWYVSGIHSDQDIDDALGAVTDALVEVQQGRA